ncbi:MAG: DUF1501 domain-containing protein [Planctomyces sp.]|jgi:hypothetical protein|nr:DUF1501 domain-containing protein [Planctomyces sp.]HAV31009.1 DUF1501 domain-containing protein [Planctomycetaceae bacterium]HBC61667.1 DUF1501 domain-containing protein [Planctomycetaceae bacterium]
MLRISSASASQYCDGYSRRSFVQLGATGLFSAGLPGLLAARAAQPAQARQTSVILLWLDGGPGHMDTYDMKPEAPAEYRGIWKPIPTCVPGMEVTELFPLQAKIADRFSVVRSLHHGSGDHFTGGHWMLTGRGAGVSGANTQGKFPFFGALATKLTGPRAAGMPANVAVPYGMSIGLRPGYFGGHFLGVHHNPFETEGDPNAADFQVRNIGLAGGLTTERLGDRRLLLTSFDRLRREADVSGAFESLDRFDRTAFEMVTGQRTREAFDLSQERPELRERYGRNSWGQSTLLARRLVEAGTTFVTCHFGGWDHHWDLKSGMENYLPKIDQLVYGLITDLSERGLLDSTLVLLCGEFSRTPRMNDGGNGGPPLSKGTPGRDHWGSSMFCFLAGGGVQGGRLIGSTDRLGEAPKEHPLRPGDIHHTVFHVLGINPETQFPDHSGRPITAVDHGAVIRELF